MLLGLALVLALAAQPATALSAYVETAGVNCDKAGGAIVIDNSKNATTKSLADCQAFCDATPGKWLPKSADLHGLNSLENPECHCVVYQAHEMPSSKCFRRAACV